MDFKQASAKPKKKKSLIAFRLTEEDHAELKKRLKKKGVPVSLFFQRLVVEFLCGEKGSG